MTSWGSSLRRPKATVGRKRSILTIISKYTQLRELGGRKFVGVCPIHNDTDPSLVVYAEDRSDEHFHCFGCGAHGDVIDFVRLVENCSFERAVEVACSKTAVDDEIVGQMRPPKKDLNDERAVAHLLLASYVRALWPETPPEKWQALNRAAHRVGKAIETSQAPIEAVNKVFRKS